MSITSADDRRTRYNPVVATTDFAADFPVFDNDDIKVFVDGVERDDFAVTATYVNGISNDAKAVFAVGVTGTVDVVGYRDPHRTNRFVDGAPLPTRDINLALDTLEGESQEARRDIAQAAKSPYGSAAYEFDPNLADGQALMKSGSKLVPGPTASQIASAEGYATAAASSASQAASSETTAVTAAAAAEAAQAAAEAAAQGAVRFDVAQATSSAQKAQGRENVGLENIVPNTNGTISYPTYGTFYDGMTTLGFTYGGGQSAVGSVVTVNGLQFGVPNYIADPTLLSTHASRDHVGQFVFMEGAQKTQVIPDLGTTYTSTYIQNSAIVASDNLKVGMVIDTRHSPKWSGVITAIDDVLHRATVDAWYLVDGSSTTGTPSDGIGANSNPTTKVFGGNTAVWFGKDNSLDVDGHGHELDMVFWRAGLGVYYGWDAVAYGAFQPATNIAHSARWGGDTARFTGGFYAEDTIDDGAFWGYWRAGGDYVRPLVRSKVGADELYTVTAAGQRNADRVTYVKTAVNLTVNAIGTCVVICTNAAGTIDITLPAFGGYNDGRYITIVTLGAGGAAVKKPGGATMNTLVTGEYQDVLSDGTDWLPIKSGPVV